MPTRSKHLVQLLTVLLALAAAIGCSNPADDSSPTQGSGTTPPPAGGAGGSGTTPPPAAGGAGMAAPASASFSGTVVESTQDKPITHDQLELKVTVLDNVTGMPLGGKEGVQDGSAAIAFADLPPGDVGFMIKGVEDQAIDTYTFNVPSNEQGKLLRVVAKSSVLTVKTVANVTLNPDLADIAGAIYWKDASGVEQPVGCATVAIDDGQGEIRYFGSNNLPTTNVALPSAPNLEVRTATNPLNGRFFITGVSLKPHTVTAMVNGMAVGSATLPVFQGKTSTDGENAISLTDILVEGASANPTPSDCM